MQINNQISNLYERAGTANVRSMTPDQQAEYRRLNSLRVRAERNM